jgi:regulator of sigma E protease
LLSTVFAFVLTLGIVIIIHELGHFAVCKWTGIYVKTFSIGFGPKILRKRFGETEYALSIVPFGGYVKMAGEGVMEDIQDTATGQDFHYPIGTEEGNREAALRDDPIPTDRHFRTRPAWQRLAVVLAGPLANLVLAFVIYTISVMSSGLLVVPVTDIGYVRADSPAAEAGLMVGDRILEVDGNTVEVWEDILRGILEPTIDTPEPVTVDLLVDRDGRQQEISLTPTLVGGVWNVGLEPMDTRVGLVQRGGPAEKVGLMTGDRILSIDDIEVNSFGEIARLINARAEQSVRISWLRDGQTFETEVVPEAAEVLPDSTIGRIYFDRLYDQQDVGFPTALRIGFRATIRTIQATVMALADLADIGLDSVGGPIRIGQVAGEMLRWSFGHLMQFIAFFSVNLFLLNLLPIPVLDGGHVVFILIEMIFKKQVNQRVQAIATQVGLIMLLLLMTFVIVVDFVKVLPS